jgi:uncharacterized Zn finger protein
LSEATIRHHVIAQSFERGQGYYRNGSVTSLIQRGNVLSASVEGSEVDPYRISIHFDKGGITSAICTCLYDYEGWCKHIVATLLTCLHQPDQIEQRSELAELLAPLNQAQYYYHAVNWLRKVRAAYLQLGQLEEWKRYRTALIQTHARKRKLVSLLQSARLHLRVVGR